MCCIVYKLHEIEVISKWSRSDNQMIEVIWMWYRNDLEVISKWYSNEIKVIFKWYQNDIQMKSYGSQYEEISIGVILIRQITK